MQWSTEYDQVLTRLMEFVRSTLLNADPDQTITFEPETPLLEWGVLTSINIVQLVGYIRDEFGAHVSPMQLTAKNFKNFHCIANLVLNTLAA